MIDELEPISGESLTSGPRLVRNVVWNALGEVGPLVAAFIAMPVLVHSLGTEKFGIIALAWTIFGYFGLFDIGISSALTKLASDRLATDRETEIPALIGTSLLLMIVLGLVGSAILAVCTPLFVEHLVKVALHMRLETERAFELLLIALPICLSTSVLTATLSAYQRFDLINLVQSPNAIYSSLAPLAVLPFSHSIVPIIGVLVVGHAVTWFVYYAMCTRAVSRMTSRMRFRIKLIPELLGFGVWVAASTLLGTLSSSFDRFVLAAMASLSAVSYYVVPARILHKLRLVPGFVSVVMFPALSYEMLENRPRARTLFERAVKAVLLITFPITLVLVAFGRELLTLWVGAGFAASSSGVLRLLAVAAFLEALGRLPGALMWAAHRPDLGAKIQSATLPFYFVFILLMVHWYGALGAAIACVARSGVMSIINWIVVRNVFPEISRTDRRLVWFSLALGGGLVLAAMPVTLDIRIEIVSVELIVLAAAAWRGLLVHEERVSVVRAISSLWKSAAVYSV
jgi:O-antigen/teichoic acid export membrane protein